MADPFLAEIRIFPFTFAPKNWAFCNGQLMPLSQNTALFALLGTMYGGNGKSNFALPDLQGRTVLQHDQGPGLTLRDIGESGGQQAVTLIQSEMPAHSHTLRASAQPGEEPNPAGDHALGRSVGASLYRDNSDNPASMATQTLAPAGASLPHNNMMPCLTLHFCIALQGIFPPRT